MAFDGPKKSASSSSPANPLNCIYTQNQVRQLLDLVCYGDFISFKEPDIFLKTAVEEGVVVLQTMLHDLLDKEKSDRYDRTAYAFQLKAPLAEHRAIFLQFEARIKPIQERQKTIIAAQKQENVSCEERERLKSEETECQKEIEKLRKEQPPRIEAYEWAVVCKLAMQKGAILPVTVANNVVVKRIFLEEIKALFSTFQKNEGLKAPRGEEPDLKFNKKKLRPMVKQLIGQLCEVEAVTAEIVHNYLHLASRVLRENTLTDLDIAVPFAPGLFEGLEIFQKIAEEVSPGILYRFVQLFVASIIADPIFSMPFSRELYRDFKQSKFAAEMERSNDQKAKLMASGGTLIRNGLSSLASTFATLTMSSSESIPAAEAAGRNGKSPLIFQEAMPSSSVAVAAAAAPAPATPPRSLSVTFAVSDLGRQNGESGVGKKPTVRV